MPPIEPMMCADCAHFVKDPIGSNGIGQCALLTAYRAKLLDAGLSVRVIGQKMMEAERQCGALTLLLYPFITRFCEKFERII